MYTKRNLRDNLEKMGFGRTDTVLIHSSMKSIGEVDGGAEAVLDVLTDYFVPDGNLILPTHSWGAINNEHNIFDPETEPSCVGILPELFRKRPGVIRSLHPTHSIGIIGRNAAEYVDGEHLHDTPCPRGGCWGRLYDYDAKIMFLGCPLTRNTYLHGVEEWNHIPNRLTDKHENLYIKMNGELYRRPMRRHYNEHGDISSHYDRLVPFLEERDMLIKGRFGDAECVVMRAVDAAGVCTEILGSNPDFFGFKTNQMR